MFDGAAAARSLQSSSGRKVKHSPLHLLLLHGARAQVAHLLYLFLPLCHCGFWGRSPEKKPGWWETFMVCFPVSLGNSRTKMRLSQPFSFPFLTTSGKPPVHGRPPCPRTLSPSLCLLSQEEIPATSRWPQVPASWGLAAGDLPGCASSS